MATFTAMTLSAASTGLPIKVAATSIGSGTPIHTATSSGFDEISLYVSNTDTAAHTLTIAWGGTTDPDCMICKAVSIPPSSGPWPVVASLRLGGGLSILAAADSANKLLVSGIVNRIV